MLNLKSRFSFPATLSALLLSTTLVAGSSAHATEAEKTAQDVDLFSLSLTELADIEITSVSKRNEKASTVAAAVHVITAEDIKRSGVTSIPEALRLAPGVNVAQAGNGQWAISIRGFNAQFSNKLLVLIDGRSVYTPFFSGVLWDVQDTMLEDVDRIEVIRGPGGTIWGANAVNGVINIITKKANDTQGTLVSSLYGNQEHISTARYGGKIGDDTHYRAFLKQTHGRDYKLPNGTGADDKLDQGRAGMRVDMDNLSIGSLTLQSEIYAGTQEQDLYLPALSGAFINFDDDRQDVQGGHILSNWTYNDNGNEYSLKTYFDNTQRDTAAFEYASNTFDLDFNHSFRALDSHNINWGLGYRLTKTESNGTDYISFTPEDRTDNLYSFFLQDKIALLPEELFLTLGSKFEHNSYTGFEYQPSARMSWLPDDRQTLWASVSRAVRTPSRAVHDLSIAVAGVPSALSPTGSFLVRQIGADTVDSEELIAYEAGYRVRPTEEVSLDFTGFYNDYPTLVSDAQGAPFLAVNSTFGPHIVLPYYVGNASSGSTFGFEASADWQATPHLMLGAGYSYLEMDIDGGSTFVSGEGRSPQNQFNLEAHYSPTASWEADALLYFVDKLNPSPTTTIPSYWRFDTRLAYNFDNGMTFSLVGQNLLDDQKTEFSPFVYNSQLEVPRSFYGKLSWKF